jgi:hypothetical protein
MSANTSIKPLSSGGYGLALSGSSLLRALPEPRNSLASWGNSLLSTGATIASSLVPGGDVLGMNNLTDLLNMQIQIQREMQVISMASNIEKSRHETEMAPIRNMRVG